MLRWRSQPAGCSTPTPPAFVQCSTGSGTCADPNYERLLRVGGPADASAGVFTNAPTCGTTGIDPNGLAFFSATEIDVATLPEITDVTE